MMVTVLWVRAKKELLMTKIKFVGTAIAAMFLMSSAANAADLYTPEPTPVAASGWYFSGFGGANWADDTSFDTILGVSGVITNEYDTGFVVGGAFGYDFGQAMGPLGMRLEGEVSYRDNDVDTHVLDGGDLPGSDGSTSALAGMANLLFDFNTGGPFSFYGGGGVGVANVEFDSHSAGPTVLNDDDTVFAWQAIAGVGFEVAPGWVLDVQYRYFNASDVSLTSTPVAGSVSSSTDYESHAVVAGIRWSF
jgi:opacity protein-like surface antigen